MNIQLSVRRTSIIYLILLTQAISGAAHDETVKEASQLCIRQTSPDKKHAFTMAFLPVHNQLVTVSGDNKADYWDARTAEYLGALPCGALAGQQSPLNPTHVAVSPDGSSIALSQSMGVVRLFGSQVFQGWPQQQHPFQSICHRGFNDELIFSSDSRYLISSSPYTSAQTLFIHCIRTNHTKKIKARSLASRCLAAHPTESSLFANSSGPLIRLYNVKGKTTHSFHDGTDEVISLRYSPDGKELASTLYLNSIINIWDAYTGQLKETLPTSDETIGKTVYSPDGRQLAYSTFTKRKGIVRLYDRRSQQISHTLDGNQNGITSLAYNSDDNLVSASGNGTLCIWDSRKVAALTTLACDEHQKKPEKTTICRSRQKTVKHLMRIAASLEA